ncbi:hypothetical protein GGR55DRAFT_49829 [Xylaria sp. FL0064]|nr:hypothetical protein GGR55DRAFT_49829 [Xylaria sp. FL0064]
MRLISFPDYNGSPRECEAECSVFMHYMRSFIVCLDEGSTHTKQPASGLKCLRDHITFRGFYNNTLTKLIETRYSTALSLLPLQRPAGHYVLVSICDGQQKEVAKMFDESPGGDISFRRDSVLLKRYGIYPAGLLTGISMFQVQICVFIDSWEQDWTCTIGHIDKMVSLNLNVLENDDHLRNLVLGNNNDNSVLYFKVLQLLNGFSDMARAAPSYLDTLRRNVPSQENSEFWFLESYPHTEKTRIIIKHNWEIVAKRQRDASDRILKKLERTSNEVKALQSGLLNVQSITEARKSRILNKYLMVFIIVTIIFLPPTFVAVSRK